jgi:hypothetical protein
MPDINDYRQEGQQADLWCWAAVGVSMSRYYERGVLTQCEFVRRAANLPDCPNRTFDVAAALSAVPCLAGAPIDGPITETELREQLRFGFPVCVRVELDETLAHVVVAVGCEPGDNPMVTILDPAEEGSVHVVPYAALRTGGFRGPWLDTFLTA